MNLVENSIKPIVAIGLDGADPVMLKQWIDQGELPNLEKINDRSSWFNLSNIDKYRAEVPWTSFLTGVSPDRTGYWGRIKYDPDSMTVDEYGAYDFVEFPPFYDYLGHQKTAIFDMPQARLSDAVNGLQMLAWGAHSPRGPSVSNPESLFQDMVNKYGEHPTLNDDHANIYDSVEISRLIANFELGIQRRTDICADLLNRDSWDFFLVMYSETHSSGHTLFHTASDHPVNLARNNSLLSLIKKVDKSIGELLDHVSPETRVVVFSVHGMIQNVLDLPSMLFLPEFLYRMAFGTSGCLTTASRSESNYIHYSAHWAHELWNRRNSNCVPELASPDHQRSEGLSLSWQPANWYQPAWPDMQAFALPSYSDGYIRVSLKGRDVYGLVEEHEYDDFCDHLEDELAKLTEPISGRKIVRDVVRTRRSGTEIDIKLPDADLIVLWEEMSAYDCIEHPTYGQFGPAPYFRTGGHNNSGFAMITDLESGCSYNEKFSSLDLTPTLLSLLGVQAPEYMEGRPLPGCSL